MEFGRMVCRHALFCGWFALLAWLVTEQFAASGMPVGLLHVAMTVAFVGGGIGCGLAVSSNVTKGFKASAWGGLRGFLAGAGGGFTGGFFGELLYSWLGLPRFCGWILMGGLLGLADGIAANSPARTRNVLIGGIIGGLVGGLLFDPIAGLINSPTGMSSRAASFVVLGLCIGAAVGLVEVILKDAWLTVIEGYRSGRQHIIETDRIVIGRSEFSALPLLGASNRDLASEHAVIERQPNGTFLIRDGDSSLGTYLNGQKISESAELNNNDIIKIGSNHIHFRTGGDASSRDVATGESVRNSLKPQPKSAPPPPRIKSRNAPTTQLRNQQPGSDKSPPSSNERPIEPLQPNRSARRPPPPPPNRKTS